MRIFGASRVAVRLRVFKLTAPYLHVHSREIDLPSKVVVKRGIMGELGEYIHSLGYENPLYIVNAYTKEHFMPEGVSFFDAVEASLSCADAALSSTNGHDVVVGLGGGKNIDIAKYAGWKAGLPVISVPTIPSHDGIASPMISLSGRERPYSYYSRPPHYVLIDPEVLANSPKQYILSGYGDVIGKYTSVYDWWLAHVDTGEYFGSYSAALAKLSFKHVVRFRKAIAGRTYDGINVLLEALVTNGIVMGIQHSSRPASGSEHLISHAIDHVLGRKGLHGLQVGLATIVAAYLQGRDWERIRRYLEDVGAPTTADALGIPADVMVRAVVVARTLRDRYTVLHKLEVDEILAKKALEATEVV